MSKPLTSTDLEALLAQRPAKVPEDVPIGVLDDRGNFRPVAFGGWRCVEERTGFAIDTLCLVMMPAEDGT
jgi:hypothetical protein